mgnify:CR=1 FL=1
MSPRRTVSQVVEASGIPRQPPFYNEITVPLPLLLLLPTESLRSQAANEHLNWRYEPDSQSSGPKLFPGDKEKLAIIDKQCCGLLEGANCHRMFAW